MSKKDVRVYFDSEYCEYLKQIADEKDVSLNHLIVSLVRKKYPMPRKPKEDFTPAGVDRTEIKKLYEEITNRLEAAQNGGPKIKPYEFYTYLVDEQKRLKTLLGE